MAEHSVTDPGGSTDNDMIESLQDLCLRYCVDHPEIFCYQESEVWKLREGIRLPQGICETLLGLLCSENPLNNNQQLYIFADTQRTRVRRMNLAYTSIQDNVFCRLIEHEPQELNIVGCRNLYALSLIALSKHAQNIVSFSYGNHWGLFHELDLPQNGLDNLDEVRDIVVGGLRMPQLRALTIRNIPFSSEHSAQDLIDWLLLPHPQLRYLDISGCDVILPSWETLASMDSLTSLILHEVHLRDIIGAFSTIRQLKQLRNLDLSQCEETEYGEPAERLRELVQSLPNLRRLDISGTNLCSPPPFSQDDRRTPSCGIPGLEGVHLDFLGLMNCGHSGEASGRQHIPADQVTGYQDEAQVFLALQTYRDRPCHLLRTALKKLHLLLRTVPNDIPNKIMAIQLVLNALNANRHTEIIQDTSMYCLYKIARLLHEASTNGDHSREGHLNLPPKLRREMVSSLLATVKRWSQVPRIVERALITLMHFDLPNDLTFAYRQVILCLLPICEKFEHQEACNMALYILKSMSSQVAVSYKVLAGELGVIEKLLDTIMDITEENWGQMNIMQKLWSVIWSLTDITPPNCKMFLDLRGLDTFMLCYKTFPEEPKLFQKMAGLLVNIAEVNHLRAQLMTQEFINCLSAMMVHDIHTTNSVCGILSYLLSDGPNAWTIQSPSRDEIMQKMHETIASWDLESKRSVRYRSFVPMITLLDCFDTPVVQYWAAWEICSMVKKDAPRYSVMLGREGGMHYLSRILHDSRSAPHLLHLIKMVIAMFENTLPVR